MTSETSNGTQLAFAADKVYEKKNREMETRTPKEPMQKSMNTNQFYSQTKRIIMQKKIDETNKKANVQSLNFLQLKKNTFFVVCLLWHVYDRSSIGKFRAV